MVRGRREILIFNAGELRHQGRFARAEEAAQYRNRQRALAGSFHALGRGLDGFEQVRVLSFLLLRAVRVRVGMVVGHFRSFGVLLAVVWVRGAICSHAIISAINLISAV